jgi:hypothetical protein
MKKFFTAAVLVFALAGCGSNGGHNHDAKTDEVPKEVKVEVKTNPKTIKPNEKTEIQAIVTQDGKKVDDADDVKFEIWKDGDQKHEMIEAKHKGNGVYTIEKEFSTDGIYHIIAHTNARDMHVMPEVKVTVGNGQTAMEGDHTHADGHEHGNSDVSIYLMAENLKANTPVEVMAHVQEKGAAVSGAKVQFEIWSEGSEKHEYVPAKEGIKGEYKASPTFKAKGDYHIKIHVEKDELHEHTEQIVKVK